MPLPVELRPPLEVALARPVATIPAPGSLSGGARYEPKWDGFRLVLAVDEAGISLWSRQGTDLTRAFPELVAAATQLPPGVVLDGEAVVWVNGRLDFDALLRRTGAGSATVARLAREHPASYVAFDVLAIANRDTRHLQFDDRRSLLEELSAGITPPLNLSPVTRDVDEATQWFDALVRSGIEGLVVKGGADPYTGGQRAWVKVKHRDTLDVICAAVIGDRQRPAELVIGLPVGDVLRIVGRSTPLSASAARSLGRLLHPPNDTPPWPEQLRPGAIDRFNQAGPDIVNLTLVQPLVVEISADIAMTGTSFRHAVRYLRARPEILVDEVVNPRR